MSSMMSPEMLGYAKSLYEQVTKSENGIASFCYAQGIAKSDYDSICSDAQVEDFDRFLHYLMSPHSDAVAPLEVDASYPLCDYFVSSSHNTYLWGNQLYGKASVEAYRNVLERGCRSVEIDVWDPEDESDSEASISESDNESGDEGAEKSKISRLSKKFKKEAKILKSKAEAPFEHQSAQPAAWDGIKSQHGQLKEARSLKREPRVLHGHTATKEVPFRTVCETIKQYAFQTSDLPIIVSLEVHTSPLQQKIMVEIMKEVWDSYLGDLSIKVSDDTPLPTLDSLRKRILVKVKYTAPEDAKKNKRSPGKTDLEDDSSDGDGQTEAIQKGKIVPELGCMGIYTRSYHFRGFDQPEAKFPTHVFSLSEKQLINTHKRNASALFHHNKRYLMRAYPKVLRITSSNLDPAPFWRQGVQMVALNWQYVNAAMMLNHAMFYATGGWVLKPEKYRSEHHSVPRNLALSRGTLDLSIEVFAGQKIGLPGKRPKLYVRCELHVEDSEEGEEEGLSQAGQSKEGQLKTCTEAARSGSNPDFQRQVLRFDGVPDVAEELTFIRFKVMDDETLSRDDMVAWACFKLCRLEQGIRLLHLYDPDGQPTEGVLLVKISKSIRSAQGRQGSTVS